MCSAALGSLGIGSVVFGCSNDKFGGCGSILSLHNGLTTSALAFPCQGGVREEEAIELFRRFYERPNDKGKRLFSELWSTPHLT
jgi:tRNA-specific adenosine deaminase 2